VEDEIIKALENITSLRISPSVARVTIMRFDLEMSKELFTKFEEWLINKGFEKVGELKFAGEGRRARYENDKEKKEVDIIYVDGDIVVVQGIMYTEQI